MVSNLYLSPTSISGAGTETITVTATDGTNTTDGGCTVNVNFVLNPDRFAVAGTVAPPSCPDGMDGGVTLTAGGGGTNGGVLFYEGFESGGLGQFSEPNPSIYTTTVTTTAPAAGSTYSVNLQGGNSTHDNPAIETTFSPIQPTNLSFYMKAHADKFHGYFRMLDDNDVPVFTITFFKFGQSFSFNNCCGTSGTGHYTLNQWHHVELRDIDWVNKRYNFYIDNVLQFGGNTQFEGLGTNGGAANVAKIYMYNYNTDSDASFDEITLSTTGSGPTYTYAWENSVNPGTVISTEADLSGVAAGTYQLTASDGNCTVTEIFTITDGTDTEAPFTPILPPTTVDCGATVTAPTTTDNCAGIVTGTTTDATSFSGEGTYSITWTFEDGNNNSTTATQAVTVDDTNAPTFTCPAATTLTLNLCNEYALTPADLGLTGTDNCGGAVTFSLDQTEFTASGDYDVAVTATDESSNSVTGTCTVTVTFETNPDFFTITADAEDLGTSCPGAAVPFTAATLLDGDIASNGATLEIQEVTSDQGTITDDGNGNYTFTPNQGVTGNIVLTYIVKVAGSDLFFEDNGHFYEFVAAPNITWTDAKVAAEARTLNGQQGYLVTITTLEEQGFVEEKLEGYGWTGGRELPNNSSNMWYWVTGPEGANGGTLFSSGATAQNGLYVNWRSGEPNNSLLEGASEREQYVHLRANGQWNDYPNSFTPFTSAVGPEQIDGYVVEYGAADCVPDQTAEGSISLTIEDTTPPVITCPANIEVVATSAAGATATFADATATDNCTVSVAQTAGLASGATFPIGESTVEFTATDAGGNAVPCSFTVTVSGTAPDVVCPDNITVSNDTGDCAAIVSFTATDATGVPASTITYSQNPGTSFPVGTTMVTATATNAVGSDQCSFMVTVVDNEDPDAVCQDITVQLDAVGMASITAEAIDNGSDDNCGIVDMSLSVSNFDCDDIGGMGTTISQAIISNSTFTESTVVLPGGSAGASFNGVGGNLPDVSTYTVAPLFGGNSAQAIPGTQSIRSTQGIHFFRKTFNLASIEDVLLDIQLNVDNQGEIYLNGNLLARESTWTIDNFLGTPYHRITIDQDGVVQNGFMAGQVFDYVNNFLGNSAFVVGENELVFVVRNPSGGGDIGGISVLA
ncbi:MAG: HYR domain-containing protein [Saprospiraceae bacterium]